MKFRIGAITRLLLAGFGSQGFLNKGPIVSQDGVRPPPKEIGNNFNLKTNW
jgi:hypothetical protein